MKLKRLFWLPVLLVLVANLHAQGMTDYYARNAFLLAPASGFQYGLLGYANPAMPAFVPKLEAQFHWNQLANGSNPVTQWGIFGANRGFGFQLLREKLGNRWISNYATSLAIGKGAWAAGVGFHWARTGAGVPTPDRLLSVGWIFRPNRFLSVGTSGHFSLEHDSREGVLEAGFRPLGSPVLTIFGAFTLRNRRAFSDSRWSAGGAVRILPGIYAIGRYFNDKTATAGLSVNFGHSGVAGQARLSGDNNATSMNYAIRMGALLENAMSGHVQKEKRFVPIWPKGTIVYHTYRFGDKSEHSFFALLKAIQNAAADPRVAAIVLNLADVSVQPEHAWEIRQALKAAQKNGKKVIIFFENAGINQYHLASVADRIVMDPIGSLSLEGFVMGRTFYKNALEKLGLGFDELRFFKYKSAVEVFSRKKMSQADRAQRQDYVNDRYQLAKTDICQSRGFSSEKFDRLVNNNFISLADSAQKAGLVDTLARWSDREKVVKALIKKKVRPVRIKKLLPNEMISSDWGVKPKIALVYALGTCDMNKGIRARWLAKVFKKLEKTKSVRAVVFRVDSPGGDGMASDLVAEAMKSCAKKKPVIVSQGQVAGSGGYWISMFGDTIVAGPNTVTGSIGVIGGWIYDKGFSGKIGFTADHVKRGKHADVGFGIFIPYLGMLPERDLTADERASAEYFMKAAYEMFVKKVATGRSLPVDSVKQIAQGHFYSGMKGQKIGLVDVIGGLQKAIQIAKKKAGLKSGESVEIVEIPKYKGLFKSPLPNLPFAGTSVRSSYAWQFFRMVAQSPGRPLFMIPPETIPVNPVK